MYIASQRNWICILKWFSLASCVLMLFLWWAQLNWVVVCAHKTFSVQLVDRGVAIFRYNECLQRAMAIRGKKVIILAANQYPSYPVIRDSVAFVPLWVFVVLMTLLTITLFWFDYRRILLKHCPQRLRLEEQGVGGTS